MSVLSRPLVADAAGLVLGAAADLASRFRPPRDREGVALETTEVPTRHGAVGCTIYRSTGATDPRPPAYVNVHGGGFVIGHPAQDDPWCAHLAARTGATVLNLTYATAPRRRFPVALEQVHDVIGWAAGPEHDWDGTRVAAGGQSAGGNLTAAAARLALQQGGPTLRLQVLHYAVLDLVTARADKPPAGGREVPPAWMSEVFHTAYIPDPARRRDPLASPAWGANASGIDGIAPALLVTAEHDPLRGEGARYAEALRAAGALVEHIEVAGVGHGYDILDESGETTRTMRDRLADRIATALA